MGNETQEVREPLLTLIPNTEVIHQNTKIHASNIKILKLIFVKSLTKSCSQKTDTDASLA